LPTEYVDQDVELVLVIQAKSAQKHHWPPDFFEKTYGCLADDPIERGEQEKYEVRDICAIMC